MGENVSQPAASSQILESRKRTQELILHNFQRMKMKQRSFPLVVLCSLSQLTLIDRIDAFTTTAPAARARQAVGTSLASTVRGGADEEGSEYHELLQGARAYAWNENVGVSSDGSGKNAKDYLWGILELESACVSGNLLGEDDLCAVDGVADTVVRLREKTIQAVENPASPWLSSIPTVPASPTALGVSTAVFVLLCLVFRELHLEVTPFTLEEWVWAVQGGYAGDMVEHYLRNGGV